MKIYLAHPISGKETKDIFNYYSNAVSDFSAIGYDVLYPMIGKAYLRNDLAFKAYGYDNPVSTNRAIVGRDHWMVSESDIVLVDLSDSDHVSIGCIAELAWAWHLRKHTIVVVNKDNIHYHAFVLEMADIVFDTLDHAYIYLEKLILKEA